MDRSSSTERTGMGTSASRAALLTRETSFRPSSSEKPPGTRPGRSEIGLGRGQVHLVCDPSARLVVHTPNEERAREMSRCKSEEGEKET